MPPSDPQQRRALRVVVACADRRIPLLAPGGAAVHLRGIASGFAVYAEVDAWVARAEAGSRGPAAEVPCPVRLLPRGRLPGVLRRHRRWDAAVDATAARRRARRWQRERPVDLVYERAALFSSLGRLPGAARVVELNAPLAWEAAWFEGEAPRPALLRAEARSLSDADLVVVVSEPLVAYARRRGVDPRRIVLLPNGADPAPAPRPSGERVLGYAGTFKPWHGLAHSVEALRALGPDRIDLWGDGPQRVAAVEALTRAGLPLRFRGWASPHRLAEERAGWWAAWIPRAPWPPEGSEAAQTGFGEPPPAPYFSPLKEAEAAASGLPTWPGEGPLRPPAPRPRYWRELAATVLRSLDVSGVPRGRGSWFNDPARPTGHPGAA